MSMYTFDPDVYVFRIRNRDKDKNDKGPSVSPGYDYFCIGDMSSKDRDSYMREMAKRIDVTQLQKTADGEEPVIAMTAVSDFEGWSTLLLERCVYYYDNEAKTQGTLVPKEVIETWPVPLVDYLSEVAGKKTPVKDQEDAAKKS